jgi:RimJ/RimL family protein N-acetyltransferase
VLKRKNEKRFAICAGINNSEYIGNAQLTDINSSSAQYHIFIGNKKYWGKGIATIVTEKIINYAFGKLNLHFIYLTVDKRNTPAIKVYLNCGFSKIGADKSGRIKMIKRNRL